MLYKYMCRVMNFTRYNLILIFANMGDESIFSFDKKGINHEYYSFCAPVGKTIH